MKLPAIPLVVLVAAACRAGDAPILAHGAPSPARMEERPGRDTRDVMRSVDGIPGWVRAEEPRIFMREGLYGHINGGAELVLQYGFRELAVHAFEPERGGAGAAGEAAAPAAREIVLEIYRMESGEAAFGLYSTRLEGGEESRPEVGSDNWIMPGQANFVKGEYLVNILASDRTDREVGAFMAAIEKKVPGEGTVRPAGMSRLPVEGMVPGSGRYIKGALAAQNESPFLEAGFWGFGEGRAEAYAARYGAAPALSKLIIVEFGAMPIHRIDAAPGSAAPPGVPPDLAESVSIVFRDYLRDVRRDGDTIEGRNQIGRWFLFRSEGRFAALVLGEPNRAAALSRLDEALRPSRSASPL
ncbi:MAG: hypothetical protein FJY79_02495 [Candidatus Aminicenantes bacterium]|nr:hypothetical protein [Candidatus Aminicenantes bacterium]